MIHTNCPKCGSDSFDTVKWSWRDGLPPHDDHYECLSCDHVWDDASGEPIPKVQHLPSEDTEGGAP